MHIIEFAPPMKNIDGRFNTFRLGLRYSKLLKPQDKVLLINRAKLEVMGEAIVESVYVGKLAEMAKLYAHENHNQMGEVYATDLLIEAMIKRYGPHMVSVDKRVTVIYLQMS